MSEVWLWFGTGTAATGGIMAAVVAAFRVEARARGQRMRDLVPLIFTAPSGICGPAELAERIRQGHE